jgi:hypothetical protein
VPKNITKLELNWFTIRQFFYQIGDNNVVDLTSSFLYEYSFGGWWTYYQIDSQYFTIDETFGTNIP